MTILVYRSRHRLRLRSLKKYPFQFKLAGYVTAHHSIHFIRRKLGPVWKKRVYQYQFTGLFARGTIAVKGRTPTNSSIQFISSIISAKSKFLGNVGGSAAVKGALSTGVKLLLNSSNVRSLAANLAVKVASSVITPATRAALSTILASKTQSSLTNPPSTLQIVGRLTLSVVKAVLFAPSSPIAIGKYAILVYRLRRINPRFFRQKHIFSKNNPPGQISLSAFGTINTKASLRPLVVPGLVYTHPNPLRKIKQRRHKGGKPLRRRYPFQFEQIGYTAHNAVHFIRRGIANTRKKKIYPSPKLVGLLAKVNSLTKARSVNPIVLAPLITNAAAAKVMASAPINSINNIISVLGTGIAQVTIRTRISGSIANLKSSISARSEASTGIITSLAISSVIDSVVKSPAQGTVKASLSATSATKSMARSVITNIGTSIALLAAGVAQIKAAPSSSGKVGISARVTSQIKPQLVVTNIATIVSVLAAGVSQIKSYAVFSGKLGIAAIASVETKTQSPMGPIAFITAATSSINKLTTRFVGSVIISGAASFISSLPSSFTATAYIAGSSVAQITSNIARPATVAGLSVVVSAMTIVGRAAITASNFPVALTARAMFKGAASLGNNVLRILTGIPVKGKGGDDNVTGSGP